MDTPTPSKRLLSNSGDELDKFTVEHGTSFGESSFAADVSQFSNYGTPRTSSILADQAGTSSRPTPAQTPQKKKCILELFPWLNDIEKSTQKCLGSINEVKSKTVLNAMDFLIRFSSFTFVYFTIYFVSLCNKFQLIGI